jgi:hypothetical protein
MPQVVIVPNPVQSGGSVVIVPPRGAVVKEVSTDQGTNTAYPPGSFVSQDSGNRSVLGSDGGTFTPELVVDPLAYYILAKS